MSLTSKNAINMNLILDFNCFVFLIHSDRGLFQWGCEVWSLGHIQNPCFITSNNFLQQVGLARDFPKQTRNLRLVCCSDVITKLPSKKKSKITVNM